MHKGILILALMGTFLTSGCGGGLSNSKAGDLILSAVRARTCQPFDGNFGGPKVAGAETLAFRYDEFFSSQVPPAVAGQEAPSFQNALRFDEWVKGNLTTQPKYVLGTSTIERCRSYDSPGPGQSVCGTKQKFVSEESGVSIATSYESSNYNISMMGGYRRNLYFELVFCPLVPTGISVLDVTLNSSGKAAHVVYRITWGMSELATGLVKAGFATGYTREQEDAIDLEQLDTTGWRVSGGSFGRN